MSRTFLITSSGAASFDLPDYLSNIPQLELQAHMQRNLVDSVDFIIKSAVYSAYRYIKTELLDTTNAAASEIAHAVKEMELSETTFFEQGSGRPSMIATMQHLMKLRPAFIEAAQETTKLVDARRSVASDLWAQSVQRDIWRPLDIEEQFQKPTFRVSNDTVAKVRYSVNKAAKEFNLSQEEVNAKLRARMAQLEAQNVVSEQAMQNLAPVYATLFNTLLHCDVSALEVTETRGDGHSTKDNPDRKIHVATHTFSTLPVNIRSALISKSVDTSEVWRGWQAKDRHISVDEYTALDLVVDTVQRDLRNVLASPAYKIAEQVAA